MTTLKAEKRNPDIKAKKLRREGFAPGVLFGKGMDESVPLQFAEADVLQFIRKNGEGTQVTLDLGSEKTNAVVKSIDYNPMKKQVMAFDLQALVQGEVISTSVQVKLENSDCVQGIVEQDLSEISYRADPSNLLDTIIIDFEKLAPEIKVMHVKDLTLPGNKDVQFVTPEDAMIFHISDYVKNTESEESAEDKAED
ncbi:50S ribosomal protein L25 [Ruminococcus gauvreauii]|uniref:50S ribosomal protein L25 n=1 Tax=Ruminococcus gauvreauii TaxID=438033 RepID=A0ABY5VCP9_9FIRM|nr:50S ribosomal protein L25 [Ruminococcus gauvreauii]UWP57943.1 50S ribosomal protein L25 [Ruminococcus gauvreauii]